MKPTSSFTTTDGISIPYIDNPSTTSTTTPPLVLLHGWSGTPLAFTHNIAPLSISNRVIVPTLRGHAGAPATRHGTRVARLAHDLHDLLTHLGLPRVVLLGCSMGCAIIWCYAELFGIERVAAAVFVDQSPWQMYAPDGSWRLGSNGLFSYAALASFQTALQSDPQSFHKGTVQACLTRTPTEEDYALFGPEANKAPAWFLARLMADHNNNDWRDALPLITCPSLVFAGKKSKIFPWEGVAYAAEYMPDSKLVVFEEGSHWLYYEEPQRFNEEVVSFLEQVFKKL